MAERRSTPLPTSQSRSLLGSVFRKTHRQALAGLSWLSYSPSLDLPTIAAESLLRFGLSPDSKLPTPDRLNEVGDLGPPVQDYASVMSENLMSERPSSQHTSPALKSSGLGNVPRYFRIAPASSRPRGSHLRFTPSSRTNYRIESSDYSAIAFADVQMSAVEAGLLDEASVELDKHLSMHPALRANRVVGG